MKSILDGLALGGSIIGSLLIASNTVYSGFGYLFFIIATIACIILLWNKPVSKSIMYINYFYFGTNLLGIYRWLM